MLKDVLFLVFGRPNDCTIMSNGPNIFGRKKGNKKISKKKKLVPNLGGQKLGTENTFFM